MRNEIFYNGKRISNFVKHSYGRGEVQAWFFVFDDGTEMRTAKAFIEVKCIECGRLIRTQFNMNKPYLNHQDKPFLCMSCSKKGERNSFFGKKHTQEFKEKLSNERRGVWCVGENNPMYGKNFFDFMTPEQIIAWREKHQALCEKMSGANNPMYGKSIFDFMTPDEIAIWKNHQQRVRTQFLNDPIKRKQRSDRIKVRQRLLKESNPDYYREIKARGGRAASAKCLKYQMNKIETEVHLWLEKHGIEHNYAAIMGDGKRNFQFDFIIRHRRILVEVQGDYWHGNPKFYNEGGTEGKRMLNYIQKLDQANDKIKERFALEHNFTLIYIWEDEIKNKNFSKLEVLI